MSAESEIDVEVYARILAELAREGAEVGLILARHGLDEASWAAVSARYEQVMDIDDEAAQAPELERLAGAFARAQAELSGGPAPFDVWLEVLSGIGRGEPLLRAIERAGLTLDRYLATQAHWAERVAKDQELLARYQAIVLGRG